MSNGNSDWVAAATARHAARRRFLARVEAAHRHDSRYGTNIADWLLIDAACALRYPTLRLTNRGKQED